MSQTDIRGQSKRPRSTYSPDSPTDLPELMDEREQSMSIDQNNVIMKTPQSLDVEEDSTDSLLDNPTKKKGRISASSMATDTS